LAPNHSKGENLIFLISQPRAGSTLLQKILAAHPEIHTVSEPWIALHPLFALREQGIDVNYDPRLACRGVKEFLRHLPEGDEAYWEGVRRMLTYLYESALEGSGKNTFLDKTPRYYCVIPELRRVFPHARFVFLLRNPLAVLSSILDTWVKSTDSVRLSPFRYDLMAAPRLILEGIRASGPSASVARYEEITSTPEAAVRRLCGELGITFYAPMIEYGAMPANRERWEYGDQGTVYDETRPVADRAERWRRVLKQSPKWKTWAHDYLTALGAGLVGDMGYNYEELRAELTGPDQGALHELRRDTGGPEPCWEDPGPLDELAETGRLLVERTAALDRAVKDLRTRTDELVKTRRLLAEGL
jgi:Sulfotransferase family